MTTILLSEDEPVLARNIMRALSGLATEVIHARSAALTRDALGSRSFDIVLADIALGDGDGIDVISEAGLGDTPVIVMSGLDCPLNRSRAEALPVSAFLAKPFALADLRRMVSSLMRRPGTDGIAARGPAVAMYSNGAAGFRRNETIAHALVDRVPGASVLMLAGGMEGTALEPHPDIGHVRLASYLQTAPDAVLPEAHGDCREAVRTMRTEAIDRALRDFAPDVLLVDGDPARGMDEIAIPLERLRGRVGTRTVLGLADMAEDADGTDAGWARTGGDRPIGALYDSVLVYGSARPGLSSLDLGACGRVIHCGGVATPRRASPRMPGHPRRILISGGGGLDAHPLVEAVFSAVDMLPSRRRPEVTLVTGPVPDAGARDEILCRCTAADIVAYVAPDDLAPLLSESDLLISVGNDGAIAEALALGCPVIAIPGPGPQSDRRARALAASGLARFLPRAQLTPVRLARLMTEALPLPRPATIGPDGAETAARALVSLAVRPSEMREFAEA